MSRLFYTAFCLILSISVLKLDLALSEPRISPDVAYSILKPYGPDGTCASAFLMAPNKILTNAHVVSSICHYGDCSEMRIAQSGGIGSSATLMLPSQTHDILLHSSSLDFALLDNKLDAKVEGVVRQNLTAFAAPKLGEAIYSLGYPNCGALTLSHGTVLSVDDIHIFTSLKLAHGSSGSPIFNQVGQLIGLVDESSSIVDGAISFVFGTKSNSRAIRADLIHDILNQSQTARLAHQARLLLKYHQTNIANLKRWKRIRRSIDFIAMVDGLKSEVLRTQNSLDAATSLANLGSYPSAIFMSRNIAPIVEDSLALEQLTLLYNLELNGPFESLFRPLAAGDWRRALDSSARSDEQKLALRRIVEQPEWQSYRGLQIEGLLALLKVILLTLLIISLWMLSIGYALANIHGRVLPRLLKLVVFGLLWPFTIPMLFLQSKKPR